MNKLTISQKSREFHLMQALTIMLSFMLLLISVHNKQHIVSFVDYVSRFLIWCSMVSGKAELLVHWILNSKHVMEEFKHCLKQTFDTRAKTIL